MTTATTAATVLVLRNSTTTTAIVVSLAFEITRVASSTKWCVNQLIRIVITIDAGTGRAFVTAATTQIQSMVARIIPGRIMTEVSRYPAVSRMAHIALLAGRQVPRQLWYRAATRAMAGIAITASTGIVHPDASNESGGSMTAGTI